MHAAFSLQVARYNKLGTAAHEFLVDGFYEFPKAGSCTVIVLVRSFIVHVLRLDQADVSACRYDLRSYRVSLLVVVGRPIDLADQELW